VEPWDVVVSTGYIAMANEYGVSPVIIWIWFMSGYLALIGGELLGIGGAFIHFKHPLILLLIISVFAGIISYWFLFISGIVSS